MKKIKDIIKPKQVISSEELNEWQKENAIKLPQEYANFLLQFNGASCFTEEFCICFDLVIDEHSILTFVEEFIPLYKIIENRNKWRLKLDEMFSKFNIKKEYVEVEHLIPIAEMSGGAIFISEKGKLKDSIYYCDDGDFGIIFLNKNFNSFFEDLYVKWKENL